MIQQICRRCLLENMDEDANIAALKRYIAEYPEENRCEAAEYARRLEICKACIQLYNATCLRCGCYVELRALKRQAFCPDSVNRWTETTL